MFNKDPKTHYSKLLSQITSAISKETNLITLTATISSILHESLNLLKDNKINWTGFYFQEPDGELVVGPYQGKQACQRIPKGKGVCGMAVARRQCVLIPDVHHCDEHIACDSSSKSEIVFPIIVNSEVMGVLDIDSLVTSGFNEEDKKRVRGYCRTHTKRMSMETTQGDHK
jgi:GAF domain-containing protein